MISSSKPNKTLKAIIVEQSMLKDGKPTALTSYGNKREPQARSVKLATQSRKKNRKLAMTNRRKKKVRR